MKNTFHAETFAAKVYASGTWRGLGIPPVVPPVWVWEKPDVYRVRADGAGDERRPLQEVKDVQH